MADELRYVVKFETDDASLKAVKDSIDGLSKSIPKSGDGKPFAPLIRDTEEYGEVLNKTLRRLVELNDQIRNNQGQIKSLTEASKENTAEGLKSAEQLALVKAETRELRAEYNTQEAVLNANKVAVDGVNMSYGMMRARMRELREQIIPFVATNEETAKTLADMQAEYNGLNTKIKAFDATMGNHQRNVGNYTDSFRELASTIAIFQGPLGPLAGRINALATTLNKLTKEEKLNADGTKQLSATKKILNWVLADTTTALTVSATATKAQTLQTLLANGAIKLMNNSLKLLKLAIIGTGIGALVIAIGAIVASFKSGEKGAMALARVLAPLKAIALVLRDSFAVFGSAIKLAFTDPIQAFLNFRKLLISQIVNRLIGLAQIAFGVGKILKSAFTLDFSGMKKGLDDLAKGVGSVLTGVDDLPNKMGKFGDKISHAASQALLLKTQMQELTLLERELNVLRSKQNRDLRETMALARDENKPVEERIAAMKAIMSAEEEMLEAELYIASEKLRIMEEEAKLAENTGDENEALMEQRIKVNEVEERHFQVRLRAQETINMLERKAREFALNQLRETLTAQQRLSDLQIKRVTNDMQRRGEIVELAEMKLMAFDKRLLDERRARIDAYNQEYINKQFKTEDAIRMATRRANQELESERLDLLAQRNDAELSRAKALISVTLTEQQRASELSIKRIEDQYTREGMLVELAEKRKADFILNKELDTQIRIEAYRQEFTSKGILEGDAIRMATLRANEEMELESLDINKAVSDAKLSREQALADARMNINKTQAQVELDTRIEMLNRQGAHAEAHVLSLEKIELDRQARMDALTEDFVSKGILRTEAVELAKQQITLEIDNETAKLQMATDDKVFEHKQKLLSAYISIISSTGEAIFNDNKAFAVAGAVMDTYGAINKTFRQYGYPAGVPFAAAQALAGFANVKKMMATKKGTTGGSASTGSVPAQSIGTGFGLVDVGTNQDAANFIASQQSAPPQEVNVYLQGEFDPEYLSLKVAQGNNSLAQRTVRVG